jgi:hypothetical protein
MYHILHRYGQSHVCEDKIAARSILMKAAKCAVDALQGAAMVREAASSAAILLWAAVSLPALKEEHAAMMLSQGLFFGGRKDVFVGDASCEEGSIVGRAWQQQVTP